MLLIALVFLSLLLGWATATECAAWGVLGSLRHRLVVGHGLTGELLAERDGHDADHLHDHADPGRRSFMSTLDGLYRHPAALASWVDSCSPLAPMR
jgi:hypothetical protein